MLLFLKHFHLIMDVKMICINIYSNEYTLNITAERAWESGEESSRLAPLLLKLSPVIVFIPLLSVSIVQLEGIPMVP